MTEPQPPQPQKQRMPAEWEPHAACLLLYPHNPSTFCLTQARRQVEQVASAIAQAGQEPVILYANDDADITNGNANANIHVDLCPSNDTWARDTAPTFVVATNRERMMKEEQESTASTSTAAQQQQPNNNLIIGLDWQFNAYGGPQEGCYWPCDLDQQIATNICQSSSSLNGILRQQDDDSTPSIECRKMPLILEGGSIHTDGQGTILTTEECLLHPNRNPSLNKDQIQQYLLDALGATQVLWLKHGLAFDDDTNGHVDNWACFTAPGTVVLSWTDDLENDADNYHRCRQSLEQLQNSTDAKGRSLTIHKLYLPRPIYYTPDDVKDLEPMLFDGKVIPPRTVGERMAGSYVNFYIANKAVVVPQFGDDIYDDKAIETLSALFPERQVVGVASRDILIGGGNIHCITQQVPRV